MSIRLIPNDELKKIVVFIKRMQLDGEFFYQEHQDLIAYDFVELIQSLNKDCFNNKYNDNEMPQNIYVNFAKESKTLNENYKIELLYLIQKSNSEIQEEYLSTDNSCYAYEIQRKYKQYKKLYESIEKEIMYAIIYDLPYYKKISEK